MTSLLARLGGSLVLICIFGNGVPRASAQSSSSTSSGSEEELNEEAVAHSLEMRPRIITDDNGVEWTSVERSAVGRRAWFLAVGYEISPARNVQVTRQVELEDGGTEPQTVMTRAFNHIHLQLGFGWALAGRFAAYARPNQRVRVQGDVLYFQFLTELGIPVGDPSMPVYLGLGGRLQYLMARTRHAFVTALSGGARWDFDSSQFGGELAFGVGYAYVFRKAPLPIFVQGVWHTAGALEQNAWGLRVLIAWTLGT